jgi:ADP-ribosylglycohydrolase
VPAWNSSPTPWARCTAATSSSPALPARGALGGDCGTIAAMAGAIAGACHGPEAFPADALAVIDAQGLGLAVLTDDLCALRW